MHPNTPMDSLPTYFCCGEWKKPQNISSIYIFRSVHCILYHMCNIMGPILWLISYESYDMALKHDKYLKGRLLESEINQILTIIGRIALYLIWNIKKWNVLIMQMSWFLESVFSIFLFWGFFLKNKDYRVNCLFNFHEHLDAGFIKGKEPKFEARVVSIMTSADI